MINNKNKNKPGVCFLLEDFYPVKHGATTQILLLGERLARYGLNVTVITRQIRPEHPHYERMNEIDVIRVKPAVGVKRIGKFLMVVPAGFALLKEKNRFDAIIVGELKVLGLIGVLTAKLLKKPCILRGASCGELDGSYALTFDKSAGVGKKIAIEILVFLRNSILMKADYFLSISSHIKKEFQKCNVPNKKIIDLACGVDTQIFKPVDIKEKAAIRRHLDLPNKLTFTYTGRLAEGKGLNVLISVWEKIVQKYSDVLLLLIGSGQGFSLSCENELRGKVKNKNIEKQVIFTGQVNNVHEYLKASDCFIFPTKYEALGNSLLEAMSSGLISIATRTGGIVDVIEHNVNGLLFETGDKRELYKYIEAVINDRKMSQNMAQQARKTILERFNINEKARILEKLLATSQKKGRNES
jgi:glycosyltransferase involved in cell wall biosynthesis